MNGPPFVPDPRLRTALKQTLAGAVWPRRPLEEKGVRVLIPLRGAQLAAQLHLQDPRCLTVVLVHGLEGSSESVYVRSAAAKLLGQGLNVVRLNLRGCGGTERLSPTLNHAGRSGDVLLALRHLRRAYALPALAAWGFSQGGNLALKVAAEGAPLAALVALSPLTDLAAATRALDSPSGHVYRQWFLRKLRRRILGARDHYAPRYDLDLLARVETIAALHEQFLAPAFGYRSAADYYARASVGNKVDRLRVPALVIHAGDDPVVPLPPEVARRLAENPVVQLLRPARGGHLGFVGREQPGEDRFWAENRAVDFLSQMERTR